MFLKKQLIKYVFVTLFAVVPVTKAFCQEDGNSYFEKGMELLKKRDYSSSVKFLEKAKDLGVFENNTQSQALLDSYIATCYGFIGKYADAIKYALLSKDYFETMNPKSRDNAALDLNLSLYYYKIGNFVTSLSYAASSISILKSLGNQNRATLIMAYQQGQKAAWAIPEYSFALKCGEGELALSSRGTLDEEERYATILNNLAFSAAHMGLYEKAIEYSEQCLAIRLNLFEENALIIAQTKNNLAAYYQQSIQPQKAIAIAQSAIDSFMKIGTKSAVKSALRLYRIIAVCYSQLSDYSSAIESLQIARDISKKEDSSPNEGYALILHGLANAYHFIGDIPSALYYEKEAKSIIKNIPDSNVDNYIDIFSALANHYILLGDPKSGLEELMTVDSALVSQHRNPETRAIYYNTLSMCYSRNTDPENAIRYGLLALDATTDQHFGNKSLKSIILRNLGDYYLTVKKYESAIKAYTESLSLGNKDDRYFVAINNSLGSLWAQVGDHKRSIQSFQDAYDVSIEKLGEDHQETITSLYNLAQEYLAVDQFDKAKNCYVTYLKRLKQNIEANILLMTDSEREAYWRYSQDGLRLTMTFGEALKFDDALLRLIVDVELLSKGLLFSSERTIATMVTETKDPGIDSLYKQIKANRIALTQEVLNERTFEQSVPNDYYKRLKDENYILQKELLSNLPSGKEIAEAMCFDYSNLKDLLVSGEMTVEFTVQDLSYNHDCYAILCRPEWEAPKIIGICSGEDIAAIESTINTHQPSEIYSGEISQLLFSIIWDEIFRYCKPDDTIYFSPSGIFNILNIENLSDKNGMLARETRNLVRLSSLKELRNKNKNCILSSATLLGGVYYDSQLSDKNRNNVIPGEQYWEYLPSSKAEVDTISLYLSRHGINCIVLEGAEGTKKGFQEGLMKEPSIIHIATHGYFHSTDLQLSRMSMMNSGLIMAFDGTTNDNVLTASEIAKFNLSKTDLVTISACYSGLGAIDSDGVWGLQRGFKLAGVHSIIMSLWAVDDVSSSIFMTAFYDRVMRGHNLHDSFGYALNYIREIKPDPYYWASFILID